MEKELILNQKSKETLGNHQTDQNWTVEERNQSKTSRWEVVRRLEGKVKRGGHLTC